MKKIAEINKIYIVKSIQLIFFLIIQLISVAKSTAMRICAQPAMQQDSITLKFNIINPYNRNKSTPGVLIKIEHNDLDSHKLLILSITDSNGVAQIKISKTKTANKITFFYTHKFQTSKYLSEFISEVDSVIKVKLDYIDWSYLSSNSIKNISQTAYFCTNIDSLNLQNCRFIDLTNCSLTKVPYKLKKYRKYIEILIIDSNDISKIPKFLVKKHNLRILSFANTNLITPEESFTSEKTYYLHHTVSFKNHFFTMGNNNILYSALFYLY